jgi:arabinofuranosyltransferase
LVVLAAPIVLLAALAWRHRWMSDDGFINLRVVDNIQHGFGPVFNIDERVEAYTSPLWIAIIWALAVVAPFVSLEYIAVGAGIALSLVGLAAGTRGSLLLGDRSRLNSRVAVPVGAVVVASLAPVWDFATSGLDTGLTFAWLGICFMGSASVAVDRGSRPRLLAIVVGLGPLVRPDLSIFAVGFLAVLILTRWAERGLRTLTLLAWAAAVPIAYQVFRMGYFAAVVPNTALAKDAGQADWARGWFYLKDLLTTYWLWIPLGALAACLTALLIRLRTAGAHRAALLVGVTVACALLHALYVVRLGGDFMGARLLLPAVFALTLPVAAVRLSPARLVVPVAVVVAAWAAVSLSTLRPHARSSPYLIEDTRESFIQATNNLHPVSLHDFRGIPFLWLQDGETLRRLSRGRRVVLRPRTSLGPLQVAAPALPTLRAHVVESFEAIGIAGFAAGPYVHIVDVHGLADPIAARLPVTSRYEAGHEKQLGQGWVLARFAVPGSAPPGIDLTELAAARSALTCGSLRDLTRALSEPLTVDRFFSNFTDAWSLSALHVPRDPRRAHQCR